MKHLFIASLLLLAMLLPATAQESLGKINCGENKQIALKSEKRFDHKTAHDNAKVNQNSRVIKDQPEGELRTYYRTGQSVYINHGYLYSGQQDGNHMDIVYAEDDKVYIKNILFNTGGSFGESWVEGTINGNVITVPLGQSIYWSDSYQADVILVWCQTVYIEDNEIRGVRDDSVEEIHYVIDGGTIALQGSEGPTELDASDINSYLATGLGAFWTDDDSWAGFLEWNTVLFGDVVYLENDGINYKFDFLQKTATVISKPADSGKYSGDIVIPDSTSFHNVVFTVNAIGDMAFSGCSDLTSITIPNTVVTIGDRAFDYCSGLSSVTIPNSVTTIGSRAFDDCSGLASINIGNSVTSIGELAFYSCTSIGSITCNATIPPSWTVVPYMFPSTVYDNAPLYVPMNARNAYLEDQQWKQFNKILGIGVLATGLSLDQSQVEMMKGSTLQLQASIMPSTATLKTPVWSSSDSTVASVDENGLVTALAYGTATITATTNDGSDLSASCLVMVNEYLEEYDNYLSMNDAIALHGDTIVVPVMMTNASNIIAFQTDIFLPNGLVLLKENGDYLIDPSDRMTSTHSIMSNAISNGAIRVICYSSNYKPFKGQSGDDLFYITVKVADNASGDYSIQLKNTLLTNDDFIDLTAPDVAANINVKAYLLGDANNSRTVTVTDVVVTAQYVLEMNPRPFVFAAADVNMDNSITVADVARIAWMVLNPTINPSMNAPRRAPALVANSDRMSAEGVSLAAGETRTVSIALDNEMLYSAFQLDLMLPDGLTAGNFRLTGRAGSHAFDVNTMANGKVRALCYSPALTAIDGHEGALLTFDVTATGQVNGDIVVDGIELVTTACETMRPEGFTIGVNNVTSVNEVNGNKAVARVDYYNVAGQRLDRPDSGVTLVVTTYTDGTRTTTKVIR